tara:strand:- start:1456 stop:3249 length:1794 start_codon:yes stop_codon:yes gene_type:complete
MFDHIFENRDKKVTNIIKLSDYLGRSLRENVEVFSIDDTERKVTFITESGNIIAASYNFDNGVLLENIQVESDDLFEDSDQFDDFVNYKISNFIQNIFEEDFVEADTSFNKVLQLWENRVKFSSVKKKLYEKSQKFNGSNRILESDEFQKLLEIAPALVEFLRENKNLVNIPEIKNMVRLSSAVSHAFNLPKLSYDDLNEGTYQIPEEINHTIYEMVCKQELIRKELVESKNNFNLVWLNNEKISKLASLVYERDEEVIAKSLVEAICEVPYFALATKRQIYDTITNNLELNESVKVSIKDLKAFSSYLFESKKPIKKVFISMLNEKYGISVQNLKDIPTFKSLLNTQVLIFEALAKLSPKGSVQKEVLSENAQMLRTKNGVESIDINHFIELLFEKAEYNDILENTLVEDISIKETFSSLESIDELVNLIIENKEKGYPEMGIKGGTKEAEEEEERRSKEEDKNKKSSKNSDKKLDPVGQEDGDIDNDGDEDETDEYLANRRKKIGKAMAQNDETQVEDEPRVDEEPEVQEAPEDLEEKDAGETKDKTPTSDEIMSDFKSFEDILNSINFEELDEQEPEEELEDEETEATEEEETE